MKPIYRSAASWSRGEANAQPTVEAEIDKSMGWGGTDVCGGSYEPVVLMAMPSSAACQVLVQYFARCWLRHHCAVTKIDKNQFYTFDNQLSRKIILTSLGLTMSVKTCHYRACSVLTCTCRRVGRHENHYG